MGMFGSYLYYGGDKLLFLLFSMTCFGNAKDVVLSIFSLLINMTNGAKLSYYKGNTKT
jgi:hypothetical protein